MSHQPPHITRSRSQQVALDAAASPDPIAIIREDPPHRQATSSNVAGSSERLRERSEDFDYERDDKGKRRAMSPTPSELDPTPIDPATFQASMFAMMQQLTRAIAKQSDVPRASATPFEGRVREPKVNDPEVFDGQPDKLTSFLTECTIVFELQPSRFPNDTTKINYMISFLRKSPLLAIRPHLAEYPRPDFLNNYLLFQQYLRTSYGDPDELGTARRKYRACVQKGSASSYFSELRQYLAVLGWGENSEPVVDKAIEGLKPSLKDELARKEHRPTSLSELVAYIVPLDNRLHVREIERKKENANTTSSTNPSNRQTSSGTQRVTSSTQTTTATTRVDNPVRNSSSTQPPAVKVEYPRGPLSEEEKNRRRRNNLCMYCAQPGHAFLDCPAKQANDQRKASRLVRVIDDAGQSEEPKQEQGNESAGSQ